MDSNLPKSVKRIIEALNKTKKVENDFLIKLVKNVNISENELQKYSTYDHPKNESYGRCVLHKDENFSIYVMSWLQGDFTGIHSHGHSEWGVVYFFGDADHRTYTVNGNEIKLDKVEVLKAGTIAPVCGDLVHAMGNLTHEPFITLHIYGSNNYKGAITEDSQLYEIEKNRIRTTLGPAFLNISDNLCKGSKLGIKTCDKTKDDYKKTIQQFYKRNNTII